MNQHFPIVLENTLGRSIICAMGKAKKTTLGGIDFTANVVASDLMFAEALFHIRFETAVSLGKRKLVTRDYSQLLYYSEKALEDLYVITLYKVFDVDQNSETLTKLISQVISLDAKKTGIDLVNYKKFLGKTKGYLNRIKKIEKPLNPLRNIFRTHNFPKRKVKKKYSWVQTEKWMYFAEKVLNEAVVSVGLPDFPYFLIPDLQRETEFLFNQLRKK